MMRRIALVSGFVLAVASSSSAADGYWNLNANGNWGVAANWTNSAGVGGIPDGVGDTAWITNTITAGRTMWTDIVPTIGALYIGGTAAQSYTLVGQPITFDAAGAGPAQLIRGYNGNANQVIRLHGFDLADDLIISNAFGNEFVIETEIRGSQAVTLGGGLGNGQGTIRLAGNSTYTGGTTIGTNARANVYQPDVFGTGAVVVENGGQVYYQRPLPMTNAISLVGDGWRESGGGSLGALRLQAGAIVSGPITLTGNAKISAYNSGGLISGDISGAFDISLDRGTGLSSPAGVVALSGANNAFNNLYVSGTASLQLGAGGTTASLGTGNVTSDGRIIFAKTDGWTIGNNIVITNAAASLRFLRGTTTLGAGVTMNVNTNFEFQGGAFQIDAASERVSDGGRVTQLSSGGKLILAGADGATIQESIRDLVLNTDSGKFQIDVQNGAAAGSSTTLLFSNLTRNAGTLLAFQSSGLGTLGGGAAGSADPHVYLLNQADGAVLPYGFVGNAFARYSAANGVQALSGQAEFDGGVDQSASEIKFTAARTIETNGLTAARTIRSLTIDGPGAGQGIELNGNVLTSSNGGVMLNGADSFSITDASGGAGAVGVANGVIRVSDAGATLDIGAKYAGTGTLIKDGAGTLKFSGATTNSLSTGAKVLVREGGLVFGAPGQVNNIGGELWAGYGGGPGANVLIGGGSNLINGWVTVSRDAFTGDSVLAITSGFTRANFMSTTFKGLPAVAHNLSDIGGRGDVFLSGDATLLVTGNINQAESYGTRSTMVLSDSAVLTNQWAAQDHGLRTAMGAFSTADVVISNNARALFAGFIELGKGVASTSSLVLADNGELSSQGDLRIGAADNAVSKVGIGGNSKAGFDAWTYVGLGMYSYGELNIKDNAYYRSGDGNDNFYIGNANYATGIVNVTGGALVHSNNTATSGQYFQIGRGGAGAVGELNISGAVVTNGGANNDMSVGQDGLGILRLNNGVLDLGRHLVVAVNPGTTGMVFLGNASTVGVHRLYANVPGRAEATFDGAYLRAKSAQTSFISGFDVASISTNGLTVDSAGFNVTANQLLEHHAVLGATPDGGLTKLGNGALTLNQNNTYTGPTVVSNNGGIVITTGGALGSTDSGTTVIGGGPNAGGTGTYLQLNPGAANSITVDEPLTLVGVIGRARLMNQSGTNTYAADISVSAPDFLVGFEANGGLFNITGDITGGGNQVIFLRGNANGNVLGDLVFTGNVAKTDAGTWTVGAAGKTYAWSNTQVSVGTLQMGEAGVHPAAGVITMGQNDGNAATFDLNGFDQTAGGLVNNGTGGNKTILNNGAAPATLTLNNTGTNIYDYYRIADGAAVLNLVKTGAGMQTLGGTNTYTGTTVVSNGILNVTGQLAGGGSVTVVSGATLQGTGLITGPMTIDGDLAPGSSPGILTVSNSVTLSSTAEFQAELNLTNAYDQLVMAGGGLLTLGNAALTVIDNGTFGMGDVFTIITGYTSLSGTFAGLNDLDLVTGTVNGQKFLVDYDAGGLGDVTLTVIPEPATVGLVGLMGIALLLRRRRAAR